MSASPAARSAIEHWLAFGVAGERFAIPLERVASVLPAGGIEPDAAAPPAVCGVLVDAGRPLPVIDLRRRLELADAAPADAPRVIAVRAAGRLFGLLVDRVERPLALPAEALEPLPPLTRAAGAEHLAGVAALAAGWLILLNVDRLVEAPEAG